MRLVFFLNSKVEVGQSKISSLLIRDTKIMHKIQNRHYYDIIFYRDYIRNYHKIQKKVKEKLEYKI